MIHHKDSILSDIFFTPTYEQNKLKHKDLHSFAYAWVFRIGLFGFDFYVLKIFIVLFLSIFSTDVLQIDNNFNFPHIKTASLTTKSPTLLLYSTNHMTLSGVSRKKGSGAYKLSRAKPAHYFQTGSDFLFPSFIQITSAKSRIKPSYFVTQCRNVITRSPVLCPAHTCPELWFHFIF